MGPQQTIYDAAFADGKFQREILALRWVLVLLYGAFYFTNVIDADARWFLASESFLVAYHAYYTWTVWYELTHRALPETFQYATPFLDTVAVSLALIAVGDPLSPIWGVYFTIIAGVAFFYYAIVRGYTAWLTANYALVGMALQLRGIDVSVPMMGVAMVVLLAAVYNLVAYTGGERRLRVKLGEVAQTDPLTNLPNRRGLETALRQHLDARKDASHCTAVLMVDVDRFKRYNDQFGHLAADGVLEQLAHVLGASVREPDRVARYGGDEFVVIISHVTADEAMLLAERLRNQVARTGLCTISIGVALAEDDAGAVEDVLNLADAALRLAKESGRNQVQGPWRKGGRAA
jgi:diguanylate cyclase (GGDEF)-like protein